MKELLLSGGHVALVDDDVWVRASDYTWRLHRNGYVCRSISRPGGRKGTILLHRWVMRAEPGVEVTQRNGDRLDNRRENLMVVTRSVRSQKYALPTHGEGLRASNTSGFRGVSWVARRQRWVAYITVWGKRRYLGCFSAPEAAARAWDEAAREAWGETAFQNFPSESAATAADTP